MSMIIELIVAFLATIGFAIVFNVPSRYLVVGGIAGAAGWLVFRGLGGTNGAIFLASLCIGIMAELAARSLRIPAHVVAVPGIIPLVPGGAAYSTMLLVVKGDNLAALAKGIETLFAAGSIAVGVAMASITFRFWKRRRSNHVRKALH